MLSISMNAFIVLSLYVKDRIVGVGAWSMAMMSNAVSRKKISLMTYGNGNCCGKNSTVPASCMAPVSGMKHLKHR